MSTISEAIPNYYTNKWADMYGLDRKYANEASKMITELMMETDYDSDLIEAVVLSSYPLNPPESIFEKFKSKKSKNVGKSVKITRY